MSTYQSNRPGLLAELKDAEGKQSPHIKNVCVKMHKAAAVQLEVACRIMGLSKQEFLTVLVNDGIDEVFNSFEAEGYNIDKAIDDAYKDAGISVDADGLITVEGE